MPTADSPSLGLPPRLRAGDAVSLVAPAGPINTDLLTQAQMALEHAGLRCVSYRPLDARQGYLAGDDAARARELNQAIADPHTRAVLPIRGGYGVVRILDQIDFTPLASHPKLFVGFSDITALHAAVHRAAGLATVHGPNLQDGLAANRLAGTAAAHYWAALFGVDAAAPAQPDRTHATDLRLECWHAGRVTAPIVGGNLAVLCGLVGTAWDIDCRGRILLVEDIDEAPYRVDRMLAQLAGAGKLDDAAGILIGDFRPTAGCHGIEYDEILMHYLNKLGKPVGRTTAIGHGSTNVAVPLGVNVAFDTTNGWLRTWQTLRDTTPLRPN
jgi:muramoyltetrapeptide carboxypeptidase